MTDILLFLALAIAKKIIEPLYGLDWSASNE